ncbi:MAG: efflux RND transporter periplasmic adaptor subunit [Micavibrio sp.]|nr:efflux RND transporter periplasmic adaptor subunit [Micavibrio sp.]
MRTSFAILVIAGLVLLSRPVYAHEGHADETALTGNDSASGPLDLSPDTIANLDIKTATAALKNLPETLTMPATVTLIPERQAKVTTRFDGLIRSIKVNLGAQVMQGQELLTVEPVTPFTKTISLYAPVDGQVIEQNVVLGQPVTFETILMEIANTEEVLVKGALYETPALAKVKVGQKISAEVAIYPGQSFSGIVEKIDAGPAAESRVMNLYARVKNTDNTLKPNLRGTLSVYLNEDSKSAIVVPASAVLENNGISFVYVRDKNRFEKREVQRGRASGSEVEVISGLFPDEQVVTQGNYQLQYLKPAAAPHNEEH